MTQLRLIATANTMADLPPRLREQGEKHLKSIGFDVSYPDRPDKKLYHLGGSAAERAEDIHQAAKDDNVQAMLSVFGGYNTNQILDRLDFELLKKAGKPLIGYSDFTALSVAAAKYGCPAFHGPAFASFCDPNLFEYSLKHFQEALAGKPITYESPKFFASDLWYLKEGYGPRDVRAMGDWRVLREGEVRGPIWGGNLETLTKLAGTKYMPDLNGAILFIEDSTGNNPGAFHRDMTHLRHMGVWESIAGLIVGKFLADSKLDDRDLLNYILSDAWEGAFTGPVITDVHCSHVDPMMTIPLGKPALMRAFAKPLLMVNL